MVKKRKLNDYTSVMGDISNNFIKQCEERFHKDPKNTIIRNAIVSMGAQHSTISAGRINEISHSFSTTLTKPGITAKNQGSSGRCWMFAGLNIYRYILLSDDKLDLKDFEFSEVYLFFWDKLERANTYLHWFMENPTATHNDLSYEYFSTKFLSDGGWWNYFANLVDKYGLIPKDAMKETFQSEYSCEMNRIIKEILDEGVKQIKKSVDPKKVKKQTLRNVYYTLVKFLGHPPTNFDLPFEIHGTNKDMIIQNVGSTFLPNILELNVRDFICIGNLPMKEYPFFKTYEVSHTNNVYECENSKFVNLPIHYLEIYTRKSIDNGIPVWFAGDVNRDSYFGLSILDTRLNEEEKYFGLKKTMNKGELLSTKNVEPNHAMTIVGYNLSKDGKVERWQVENSWGYYDKDIRGANGFLTMTNEWFRMYVTEVVIHSSILPRRIRQIAKGKTTVIDPWENSPTLKVN